MSDAEQGRIDRNLDILGAVLTIEAEWGGSARNVDLVANLATMRSGRHLVPDAEIAELLWQRVQLVNGKLSEAMDLLDYALPRWEAAVAASEAPSRAAHLKGELHVARAKRLYPPIGKLSAAQIGIRMARDDGRADAYSVRTVRRWLAVSINKG